MQRTRADDRRLPDDSSTPSRLARVRRASLHPLTCERVARALELRAGNAELPRTEGQFVEELHHQFATTADVGGLLALEARRG
jgi:hypothetical protein